MSDRERIIPHQLYGEMAIEKLEVICNKGKQILSKTLLGNISMPSEYKTRTYTDYLLFPRSDFDMERQQILNAMRKALEDAEKAETELDRYKALYGELPPNENT